MMNYLFTYGTLQDPKIQKALFKKLLKGMPDSLTGYLKSNITLGDNSYPILIKSNQPNNLIEGTCYELSDEEILICDDYEGDSYQRIRVELTSKKKAWVYVASA
ncbi:gamma-glutamylcyclotransferase family protein [Wenyingzhuangia sp. IMCC45533]